MRTLGLSSCEMPSSPLIELVDETASDATCRWAPSSVPSFSRSAVLAADSAGGEFRKGGGRRVRSEEGETAARAGGQREGHRSTVLADRRAAGEIGGHAPFSKTMTAVCVLSAPGVRVMDEILQRARRGKGREGRKDGEQRRHQRSLEGPCQRRPDRGQAEPADGGEKRPTEKERGRTFRKRRRTGRAWSGCSRARCRRPARDRPGEGEMGGEAEASGVSLAGRVAGQEADERDRR